MQHQWLRFVFRKLPLFVLIDKQEHCVGAKVPDQCILFFQTDQRALPAERDPERKREPKKLMAELGIRVVLYAPGKGSRPAPQWRSTGSR